MWGIPPVITVEPTNYCNLGCPLCVTGSGKIDRVGGRMELEIFRKLINEIGDTLWYVIFYHQGEPYPTMPSCHPCAMPKTAGFIRKPAPMPTISTGAMPKAENFQRYKVDDSEISVRQGGKGVCPRPWLSSLVNWDGTIVPCCFDKNGHHTMGDIKNGELFHQIWSKKEYKEFRKKMLNQRQEIDICRNCNQGFGVWV